jgi:hypothetical protein
MDWGLDFSLYRDAYIAMIGQIHKCPHLLPGL